MQFRLQPGRLSKDVALTQCPDTTLHCTSLSGPVIQERPLVPHLQTCTIVYAVQPTRDVHCHISYQQNSCLMLFLMFEYNKAVVMLHSPQLHPGRDKCTAAVFALKSWIVFALHFGVQLNSNLEYSTAALRPACCSHEEDRAVDLPACLPIFLPVCLSACLPVCLSVSLFCDADNI